jgi:hypothetical protein
MDDSGAERPYGLLDLKHAPPPKAAHRRPGPVLERLRWRDRIPFSVPSNPQFMSADPSLVHSQTLRVTMDKGVQYVPDVEYYKPYAMDRLSLANERGITGLSLRKHSIAFKQSQPGTYPGVNL